MVIKNKKKFVRAIFLIIGVTICINLLITTKAYSHQDTKYKTVAVVPGDTLWNIAEKEKKNNDYYKGKDIRYVIDDIKEVNNLKTSSLKVEQILDIPTY